MDKPFTLGVNYWPRRKAMYWWSQFDAGEVDDDFTLIQSLGLNVARALPTWTEQGFATTIRTGVTPDGRELRGKYMPWRSYKFMDEQELQAVWVYLQSLPKKEYGNH